MFEIKKITDLLLSSILQLYTVKLGYNELGYNEHSVITNKLIIIGWFRFFLL